jgi:cytochrome c peroxidase
MRGRTKKSGAVILGILVSVLVFLGGLYAQESGKSSSYSPVVIKEEFATIMARMKAAMSGVMKRQMDLLNERYDLSNRPAPGVTMSRGKPIQEGVRVKLPPDMTWGILGAMGPEEIRGKELFPAGFYPLPHPNHSEGGMLFPKFHIDEIKKQEGRDLTSYLGNI